VTFKYAKETCAERFRQRLVCVRSFHVSLKVMGDNSRTCGLRQLLAEQVLLNTAQLLVVSDRVV
jgi:hypothetical protein